MKAIIVALCGFVLSQLVSADELEKQQLLNQQARDFTQKLQGKVLPGWIVLLRGKGQIDQDHARQGRDVVSC